jgi:deoxycytidine triphosphate deaminase
MLNAGDIRDRIDSGRLGFAGSLRGDALLLHLGAPLLRLADAPAELVDLADQGSIDAVYGAPLAAWEHFVLGAGKMVLVPAAENVSLPKDITGMIGTLSHLARVGLTAHLGSALVMAGWQGHITFELFNAGPAPLRLYRGMPIARLVLFAMSGREALGAGEPHSAYGTAQQLSSRYAEEFSQTPAEGSRR